VPDLLYPEFVSHTLPVELIAGNAHSWTARTRLAAGSTVFYVLNGVVSRVPVRIQIPPATVDAEGVASFALASATTAAWQPGRYDWTAFATDTGGARSTLAEGVIRVLPDPAGKVPVDPRSYNERMLDAIRNVLAENITDDVSMYKIGGRELTKVPRETLMRQEAIYESRVLRDLRKAQGKSVRRNVPITFGGR
jgi:hypothetical protein